MYFVVQWFNLNCRWAIISAIAFSRNRRAQFAIIREQPGQMGLRKHKETFLTFKKRRFTPQKTRLFGILELDSLAVLC